MSEKKAVDDPTIKKESGSGITVGDKTLEEYVDEQEKLESLEQSEEIRKQGESRKTHYHEPRPKYKPTKQRHGRVRRWSQFEINVRERSNLMAQVQSTVEAMIVKLISSEERMTIKDLTEFAVKALEKPDLTPSSTASVMTALKRSDLGYFIEGDNDPDSKGMVYWFAPEARNLTFKQAYAVYSKKTPDGLTNVVNSMPQLEKYLLRGNQWIGKDTRPDSFKQAKKEEGEETTAKTGKKLKAAVEDVKTQVDELSEVNSALNQAIEGAIRQALGLDVSVHGRIDIVFSFKLGE